MDRNQSVGASLYSRDVNYLNIDERRKGGSLFFGRGITLFDSEEAMRRGDEALNSMSPPGATGRRTSVDFYEVPVQRMS